MSAVTDKLPKRYASGLIKHKRLYGIDWPLDMPDYQADLMLWQRWREEPYRSHASFLNPISEHFLRACRTLFTPSQLVIHPWFEDMAEGYTTNNGLILWGAASTGKSHFMGLAVLLDYITDPQNLYACLASTTKDMLMLRSFASVVEGLSHLRSNGFAVPFKFVANRTVVVPENVADVDSCKAMIKGVAISEGSEQDARASIMGVHLPRIRAVADEFENMKGRANAFMSAQSNLAVCKDHKVILAFNPQSLYSPGCALSTPVDGWPSVSLDSASWSTSRGFRVLRFDAYKSPGRANPELYPFLPNDATIQNIVAQNNGNEDAPECWVFLRAWPPPQAQERTVLTEQMIVAYGMHDRVVWGSQPIKLAALDPAFTADGDDAVLVTAELGYTDAGSLALCFDPNPYYLKIEASSDEPVLAQLVAQTQHLLTERDIPIENFGVDDSGTQSVADAITMRMGPGLYRCNFAMKPPDLPVSVANATSASKKYRNVVTWLYYTVQEFAQRGQIKGLPVEAAKQFCLRRVSEKMLPLELEPKKKMKQRLGGRSPDEADACAILIGMARERFGFVPGATEWSPNGANPTPAWFRETLFPQSGGDVNNMDLDEGRYLAGDP